MYVHTCNIHVQTLFCPYNMNIIFSIKYMCMYLHVQNIKTIVPNTYMFGTVTYYIHVCTCRLAIQVAIFVHWLYLEVRVRAKI